MYASSPIRDGRSDAHTSIMSAVASSAFTRVSGSLSSLSASSFVAFLSLESVEGRSPSRSSGAGSAPAAMALPRLTATFWLASACAEYLAASG